MPFAVALLKLALFVMWAHPTYKMTVDMYERRERRLGILPKEEESPDEANGRTETGAPDTKQTRKQ